MIISQNRDIIEENREGPASVMTNLSKDYEPFQSLRFCSNYLVGGGVPILVDGQPVILIGRDHLPLVWLAAPLGSTRRRWRYIVERNISLNREKIIVKLNHEDSSVIISFLETILLSIISHNEEANVTYFDIRPLGLDVHGDNNSLFVGTAELKNNTFSGGSALISIGNGQSSV